MDAETVRPGIHRRLPAASHARMPAGAVISRAIARAGLYLLIALGAVVFIWPLLWLVSSSVKPAQDVFLMPPNLIPSRFEWSNYPEALKDFHYPRGFANTMTIMLGALLGRLISCTMTAYAFARLRAPFRDELFVVVLATMMLPGYVQLIPQFLIFRDLGWLNSFLPLIVPGFFATDAYMVFLLRQFFRTIPRDYDDSAAIDGCGFAGVFWCIILPLSRPALAVLGIFTFMGTWNDFLGPLIYLNDAEKMPLAVSLHVWQSMVHRSVGAELVPFTYVLALSASITVVPLIVFFFTQRYFIQGIVISGSKG